MVQVAAERAAGGMAAAGWEAVEKVEVALAAAGEVVAAKVVVV